jgi:GNAT superfamily N-acetyltransferase
VELVEPAQALHAEVHPELFIYPVEPSRIWLFFASRVGRPQHYFPIARYEERPVGFLSCCLQDRPANAFKKPTKFLFVDQISVLPEFRRCGVGTVLMRFVRELAVTLDVHELRLDSWSFNEDAHRFFIQAGFEPYRVEFWNRVP